MGEDSCGHVGAVLLEDPGPVLCACHRPAPSLRRVHAPDRCAPIRVAIDRWSPEVVTPLSLEVLTRHDRTPDRDRHRGCPRCRSHELVS